MAKRADRFFMRRGYRENEPAQDDETDAGLVRQNC